MKNITNLDIADGIVVCKFNAPCEVEIIKLGLRSTTLQLYSEIRSRIFRNAKKIYFNEKFPIL
jgi:hypothetical protein